MIGRLLPLLLFVLLAILLAVGLMIADSKTDLPSPLIGKEMPDFSMPVLDQPSMNVTRADLLQQYSDQSFLLNVWASWCPPCREEHPVITELAESGIIPIIGFNYRDDPADALSFLDRFGDPFAFHMTDVTGRTSIDFGVYAAPETFLIGPDGRIHFKHIGALTINIIDEELIPLIKQLESSP